jgi:glycosyltransferase involved in cell wall biosynthesis
MSTADIEGTPPELWVHAVAAKAGGGVTYLRSVVPELIRQLDGRGVRVILLLPEPWRGDSLPDWVEARPLTRIARNPVLRVIFDQLVFPFWLARRGNARAYCSGSFAPLWKPAPTVVLLRNAIYFDEEFLARELPLRRLVLRLRGALIIAAARSCKRVLYPSGSMRDLVERRHATVRGRGLVNVYGVAPAFAGSPEAPRPQPASEPPRFLYVMNYTLQKNLGFVLEALAQARREGLRVRVVLTSRLDLGPRACFARDRALIDENRLVDDGYLELVGPKYGAELMGLYRAVDACLFPSICESFGHPLLEAMAMRRPIIAADRPYAREVCGPLATYVDPTRPESLVDVWRSGIWRCPASYDHARLATFSWQRHVQRLVHELIADAVERDAPRLESEPVRAAAGR